jgi:hypothetical protein
MAMLMFSLEDGRRLSGAQAFGYLQVKTIQLASLIEET